MTAEDDPRLSHVPAPVLPKPTQHPLVQIGLSDGRIAVHVSAPYLDTFAVARLLRQVAGKLDPPPSLGIFQHREAPVVPTATAVDVTTAQQERLTQ